MKIYTKRGDGGESDLLGGQRVLKSDDRFRALGDVDELSSWLGMVKCAAGPEEAEFLSQVQRDLITLMAHVAALGGKDLAKYPFPVGLDALIEMHIDDISPKGQAELTEFTLPGATEPSARADCARAVARRAERSLVSLAGEYPLSPDAIKYVNRLSDYLYTLTISVFSKNIKEDKAK